MGKSLVIVESPAKARTINKILGPDFEIKASMGHIRDLPAREFGVDIHKGFAPKYVTIKGRKKVIDELKRSAKSADAVYLAPDPDREGEAIAWHLKALLDGAVSGDAFHRVTYQEITASAIRKAFEQPGRIDMDKVNAQQARRILDRLVGYMVSPLLWRRIRGAASAGRVQSVALRLICEREDAIDAFEPTEYWLMGARVCKVVEPKDPFDIRLVKIDNEKAEIHSAEEADRVDADLNRSRLVVDSIQTREIRKRPQPPFITSTLQQAGSRAYSYSPSRTMQIAQRLYEGSDYGEGATGLITYMRTDSFNIAAQAREACGKYVQSVYGDEYLPKQPNVWKSRSGAQEAHEAIRPTDVGRTPDCLRGQLPDDQFKLYRLIWERFVASQMAAAVISQRSVDIDARHEGSHTYLFRATTSEVVFPGYMKVTGIEKKSSSKKNGENDSGEDEVEGLPELREGESLDVLEWLKEQKFTQPPARYSESSLVRALEENGVGRPSTYAAILSVLYNRKYIERQKRQIHPTPLGRDVSRFLVENLGELFDVGFTAEMETLLDRVEEGDTEWTDMLTRFYDRFSGWMDKAKGPQADTSDVRAWLDAFDEVKEWAEPVKRGNRTYSDEKFVTSLKNKLEKDDAAFSQRQLDALMKIAAKYRAQAPRLDEKLKSSGYDEEAKNREDAQPPRESTLEKLNALERVQFDEPRTVGKKTYDDKAFCDSLRQQAEGGKRLSVNQLKYLDRLVMKYRDQIPDAEQRMTDWGVESHSTEEPVGEWIGMLEGVTEWKEPVQRGKTTWDDRKFFESLKQQYAQRKSLSPRQTKSLRKMAIKYRGQIPDFDRRKDELNLA